jgi:hypothetical protein
MTAFRTYTNGCYTNLLHKSSLKGFHGDASRSRSEIDAVQSINSLQQHELQGVTEGQAILVTFQWLGFLVWVQNLYHSGRAEHVFKLCENEAQRRIPVFTREKVTGDSWKFAMRYKAYY